jgi:hypothetical protein
VALLRDVLLLVVDRLLVLLLVDRTGRGGSWNGEVARGGVMMLPGTDGVVAVEAVVAVGEVGAIGGVHAGGELLRQWRAEFSTLKDKKKMLCQVSGLVVPVLAKTTKFRPEALLLFK